MPWSSLAVSVIDLIGFDSLLINNALMAICVAINALIIYTLFGFNIRHKKDDTNNNPMGGMRQLQYKLKQGEASWILEVVKSHTF